MHGFLAIANVVGAALAAIFWLISALVPVPDMMQTALSGPNSVTGIIKRQSKWSALAAIFAATSALAQAATPFVG
jgi:hypothetical protein